MGEDDFEDLVGALHVACPYCGEEVELLVDPTGGGLQDYVEDCEICCMPWRIRLRVHGDGTAEAEVSTLDEA